MDVSKGESSGGGFTNVELFVVVEVFPKSAYCGIRIYFGC